MTAPVAVVVDAIRFLVSGAFLVAIRREERAPVRHGLRTAIWVGALGNALAVLPVLLSPVRSLDRLPEPAEESPRPTAATAVAPAPVER